MYGGVPDIHAVGLLLGAQVQAHQARRLLVVQPQPGETQQNLFFIFYYHLRLTREISRDIIQLNKCSSSGKRLKFLFRFRGPLVQDGDDLVHASLVSATQVKAIACLS
jgi:hypothetical protein